MTLDITLNTREYSKFVETDAGDTAVRVVGATGSSTLNVDTNSVDTSGLIGKSSGGDITTAYASATTITITDLPSYHSTLIADDIESIRQIATDGSVTKIYSRDDVALTVSSNVITVTGATFIASDTFVVFTNINDDKTYDTSTASTKTTELSPLPKQYTTQVEIVTAQDLTAAYADFGAEIDMRGYTKLVVWVNADVNTSEDCDLKVLGKHTSAGTDEYTIDGIAVTNLWVGAGTDFKTCYEFEVGAVPFIQLQAIVGTLGTAGDLTISITKIWS